MEHLMRAVPEEILKKLEKARLTGNREEFRMYFKIYAEMTEGTEKRRTRKKIYGMTTIQKRILKEKNRVGVVR